ncbi:MAG: hypothetical protein ACYTF8_16185, partial [Planctomycetota bacterium]
GLTALAVINFVFGGLSVLSLLGLIAMFAILSSVPDSDAQEKMKEAWEKAGGVGFLALMVGIGVVSTGLIITSGVGYLKQKKFLGRGLGNAYALLSIASSIFGGLMTPADAGGGFNLLSLIGFIYPVITLILINTTFKEDFVY